MNVFNWAEIPAMKFDRAVDFYTDVLDREIDVIDVDGEPYGLFRCGETDVGGAIAMGDQHVPSENGATLYLSVAGDLEEPLSRVESAGGTVLLPKSQLDSGAYIGLVRDTEGNRIGFHSDG